MLIFSHNSQFHTYKYIKDIVVYSMVYSRAIQLQPTMGEILPKMLTSDNIIEKHIFSSPAVYQHKYLLCSNHINNTQAYK
jgi:hypothetical protein